MRAVACGLVFAVIFATSTLAQGSRVDLKKPLVIASQGSFFVGGEKKALPAPPAVDAADSAAATSPSTRCTSSIRFRRTAIGICRS